MKTLSERAAEDCVRLTKAIDPDAMVERALKEFEDALAAMPIGAERIASGQQFNAYESAANDEDDEPEDWEYYLSLGPITDALYIMGIQGEWRARLVEAAFRVALRTRTSGLLERHALAENMAKALEALPVEEWVERESDGSPTLIGYVMQAQGEWDAARQALSAWKAQ